MDDDVTAGKGIRYRCVISQRGGTNTPGTAERGAYMNRSERGSRADDDRGKAQR